MPDESPRPAATRARPVRADAERNRRLILETARAAFAERGLGVRMDEIAREAGLGTGTVYRRFETKDALIVAVFEQAMGDVVALADRVLAADSDGGGLRRFLEEAGDLMADDRGLQQLLTGVANASPEISNQARTRIAPRVQRLIDNARAAGRLRAEITHDDFPILQIVLSSIIEATDSTGGELWRRYYTLVLDGLEPSIRQHSLPGPAPTAEVVSALIEQWRPQPRQPGARG